MEGAGVRLLAGLEDLAVLGLAEVVSSIPFFVRLRRRVHRCLAEEDVDLVVPIDYPGFNLPLARFATRRGIRVLYYVAPQVWAWHRSRIRSLVQHTHRLCVVLPFEEELFRAAGARADFVGHPLLDEERSVSENGGEPPGEGSDERPVLGLFPGSRAQEVERLLEPFLEAARLVEEERPVELVVARSPHLGPAQYPGVPAGSLIRAEEAARRAHAALTKSGTMTLELALHGTPMVVAYRMHPLTFWLARRLVEVEHVALVNLIAGRRLVPELLQDQARPEALAREVAPLLRADAPERERMVSGLAGVARRLGSPGVAGRVADRCVELLEEA